MLGGAARESLADPVNRDLVHADHRGVLVDSQDSVRASDGAADRARHRTVLIAVGIIFCVVGMGVVVRAGVPQGLTRDVAYDYEINAVASTRLRSGEALYDFKESRVTAEHRGRLPRGASFISRSDGSFIGPPAVAVIEMPFEMMGEPAGTIAFRGLMFAMVILSVVVTSLALRKGNRLGPTLVTVGALLITSPLFAGLALGQIDAVVMLALAFVIWGAARRRWTVVGAAVGIAILLKLSPVLLLGYLLVRGHRQCLKPAVAAITAGCVAAMTFGQPTALWTWASQVMPVIARGSRFVGNQSIPALIQRAIGESPDVSATATLGAARFVGVALAVGLSFVVWRTRRGECVAPIEIGTLVVVMLIAGPLTWDHYYVWAALPVVLLLDPDAWKSVVRWQRLAIASLLSLAMICMLDPIPLPSAREVIENSALRITTSPYVFAGFFLFAACVMVSAVPIRDDLPADRTFVRS